MVNRMRGDLSRVIPRQSKPDKEGDEWTNNNYIRRPGYWEGR